MKRTMMGRMKRGRKTGALIVSAKREREWRGTRAQSRADDEMRTMRGTKEEIEDGENEDEEKDDDDGKDEEGGR